MGKRTELHLLIQIDRERAVSSIKAAYRRGGENLSQAAVMLDLTEGQLGRYCRHLRIKLAARAVENPVKLGQLRRCKRTAR